MSHRVGEGAKVLHILSDVLKAKMGMFKGTVVPTVLCGRVLNEKERKRVALLNLTVTGFCLLMVIL